MTHGLSRRTDPWTSKAAGRSVDPYGQHDAILRTLGYLIEGNRYEIAKASGLSEYQVGRRLSELEQDGRIVATGRTRPGETGRQQRVFTLFRFTENEQRALWGDR